jgi:calcineurin-like phosphoesterase
MPPERIDLTELNRKKIVKPVNCSQKSAGTGSLGIESAIPKGAVRIVRMSGER